MKNIYTIYLEMKKQGATESEAFEAMMKEYNRREQNNLYNEDDDLPF